MNYIHRSEVAIFTNRLRNKDMRNPLEIRRLPSLVGSFNLPLRLSNVALLATCVTLDLIPHAQIGRAHV